MSELINQIYEMLEQQCALIRRLEYKRAWMGDDPITGDIYYLKYTHIHTLHTSINRSIEKKRELIKMGCYMSSRLGMGMGMGMRMRMVLMVLLSVLLMGTTLVVRNVEAQKCPDIERCYRCRFDCNFNQNFFPMDCFYMCKNGGPCNGCFDDYQHTPCTCYLSIYLYCLLFHLHKLPK